VFKALGDPTRLKLVAAIAASDNGELCICDLVEIAGLAQSTVSHHMRQLVDAKLALREQRGKWAYYRLQPETLDAAARALALG
jgi:ArsR family transcriptional regulator